MPLTFNETVPTVTDMLEYAGINDKYIKDIVTRDSVHNFLMETYEEKCDNNDIYLNNIDTFIDNIIDCEKKSFTEDQIKKIHEFRKTTNSKYIAWM